MTDTSSTQVATSGPKKVSLKELNADMERRAPAFQAVLPKHIPVERFMRVVMTAIQLNPKLALVERRSLFTECTKAAHDGLMPDGREGALVPHNDKKRGMIAVWMPMVAGLRKKVRQGGEISTWDCYVVYARDEFSYELGDDPHISHKPCLDGDPGAVVAAYSIAILKDGQKSREVMTVSQINKIRGRSRTADAGPWVTDFSEMCRKTVAKRHSKVLPMSTDLDDLVRRDEALYDFEGASDATHEPRQRQTLNARLAAIAGNGETLAPGDTPSGFPEVEHDEETGEVIGIHETHAEPPPRANSATPDPKALVLLERARVQALEGSKVFTKWLGRLNAPDYLLVDPVLDELRDLAKSVDAEGLSADSGGVTI